LFVFFFSNGKLLFKKIEEEIFLNNVCLTFNFAEVID